MAALIPQQWRDGLSSAPYDDVGPGRQAPVPPEDILETRRERGDPSRRLQRVVLHHGIGQPRDRFAQPDRLIGDAAQQVLPIGR